MCSPEYFDVRYAINPWMNPNDPVDLELARQQWECLRSAYLSLGHTVRTIDPHPGLPDMVFAANGGTVISGKVLAPGSSFRALAEGAAYTDWFRREGYEVADPVGVNEGEGDIVFADRAVIAGHGFRTERGSRPRSRNCSACR